MAESRLETEQKSSIDSEPLVSVIVPVYNTEEYLEYCLDSILCQTYKNLEIILIDDGSKDKSSAICDRYAEENSRVRVIHKKNGGLSAARNTGLDEILGEWVTFVDSDDYVSSIMVERMVRQALADSSDLVAVTHKKTAKELPYNHDGHDANRFTAKIYDRREYQIDILSGKLAMYSHGKLYKRRLFETVRFPVGKLYEDVPTTWEITKHVTQVTVIFEELYFYRQRQGSIVNSEFKPGRMDQVYAAEEIYREVCEDDNLAPIAAGRCFFSCADNYAIIPKQYDKEKKELEQGIRLYRKLTISSKKTKVSLKALAIISFINVRLVQVLGKVYKMAK